MKVTLCDVGPRDGLQNEPDVLAPAVRSELCERLAAAGLPRVEAGSFVSDAVIPQMAGAEEVFGALDLSGHTVFAGLVVNQRGYERARACGVGEIHYAFPVTDEFCARNQRSTVEEAAGAARTLAGQAGGDGVRFTVTLGVSFGCPFEGRVDPAHVLRLAEGMVDAGVAEICLADTVGVAVPSQVRELVGAALGLGVPVGVHLHNTRNTGYANALAAVESGASVLDASIGGIGGCPFAPRATGNIATEDLVYLLHGMGIETEVDLDSLLACSEWLSEQLGRELPGQVYKAGAFAPVTG
jgi:hydroxymethylglutaryl-CoA lyase/(R)-citramalyl-CoA lyase